MTEPLPDVKALTPEQEKRAIAMSNAMKLEYWGLYYAARAIVSLQDKLAEATLQLFKAEEGHTEATRLLNSDFFQRVTYKQQARAALDRVAVLEQCHREGWNYAREVEDEYRRRTGHGFGERTVEEINAQVDERLDRVERELAAKMVARCQHGNPIDPTGGYVCVKCFREPEIALPFTHWSKDPLIPYEGCNCSSCDDARTLVKTDVSNGTAQPPGDGA